MNKYQRVLNPSILKDGKKQEAVIVDVYDVCDAFPLSKSMSAIDHARKKLLAVGMRGHKDFKQDLIDVRDSINRAIEQLEIGEEVYVTPPPSVSEKCWNSECVSFNSDRLFHCSVSDYIEECPRSQASPCMTPSSTVCGQRNCPNHNMNSASNCMVYDIISECDLRK